MPRVVTGFFRWEGHATGPGSKPAPYVYGYLGDPGDLNRAPFLIDTGCDYTTLNPQDAHRLLGDSYLSLDFASSPFRIAMQGVGDKPVFGVRTVAELTFRAESGDDISLSLEIVVAQPTPSLPGQHGNWLIPSLLGRDVLEWFDLALSYNPPTVSLMEAPAA